MVSNSRNKINQTWEPLFYIDKFVIQSPIITSWFVIWYMVTLHQLTAGEPLDDLLEALDGVGEVEVAHERQRERVKEAAATAATPDDDALRLDPLVGTIHI